jgi:hypothetical protein
VTLPRASCQSPGLEEFYRELSASSDNTTAEIGLMMLRLLPEIPNTFRGKRVWGLTSHYHLCLLAADDYRTPWYVRIIGYSGSRYEIHYKMSEVDQPWPDAFVAGSAKELAQAVDMIGIAMARCGGWS